MSNKTKILHTYMYERSLKKEYLILIFYLYLLIYMDNKCI